MTTPTIRPGDHVIVATLAIGGPERCSGINIVQYDSGKIIAELGEDSELVEVFEI